MKKKLEISRENKVNILITLIVIAMLLGLTFISSLNELYACNRFCDGTPRDKISFLDKDIYCDASLGWNVSQVKTPMFTITCLR